MRRKLLFALALGTGLGLLAGCAAPRQDFDSYASYEQTFKIVTGAMADQKLIFSVLDRRHGNAVGELDGKVIKATIHVKYDSLIKVEFSTQNGTPGEQELLQRVIASYQQRMAAQAHVLPDNTP